MKIEQAHLKQTLNESAATRSNSPSPHQSIDKRSRNDRIQGQVVLFILSRIALAVFYALYAPICGQMIAVFEYDNV